MPRLIWSPAALQDVQHIYRSLAAQNATAAQRAIKSVLQQVSVLEQQSGLGRPIEDLPVEFREWVIDFGDSGYVARYRVEASAVTILAIRHQREVGF